jgi:hypothetical protein
MDPNHHTINSDDDSNSNNTKSPSTLNDLSSLSNNVQASAQRTSSLAYISSVIRVYPDFPKKGILFRDIFPIFSNPKAVECLIDCFVDHIKSLTTKIDIIVGLGEFNFLGILQLSWMFMISFRDQILTTLLSIFWIDFRNLI